MKEVVAYSIIMNMFIQEMNWKNISIIVMLLPTLLQVHMLEVF